jgi:segregation and condensation protein B
MRGEGSLAQRLEAMLTVALEPISAEELADVADADAAAVTAALRALRAEYQEDHRGFTLVELASGWELRSAPEVADWVARFANRDVSHRLSSAALETLAIVAYRQPISRAQISALRGVNVDGVCRLLEQRGYIVECGRAAGPGLPILYATTEQFLDRLGLASVRDLPPIEEFMPAVETAREIAEELALAERDAFEGP